MSTPGSANDDGLSPASPVESDFPAGVDRRSFLMRNAVIGAAAAMTGTTWTPEARARQAAKEAAQPKLGATMSHDLIAGAMLATVKSDLAVKEGVLPGPIKLHSKAATVWARARRAKDCRRAVTIQRAVESTVLFGAPGTVRKPLARASGGKG
jgi:hypothetical protein